MNVYFTVDTESSMAGALLYPGRRPLPADRHVFCRKGDEELGIPLLVRLLQRYGLRGTFFIETLATRCLGERDTRSIFDFLGNAGQDVQLHVHPIFRFYTELQKAQEAGKTYMLPERPDLIGFFDEAVQMELLNEAVKYFTDFSGSSPKVFRAGCYAGSNRMMRCLRQMSITVDSSFNPCYHEVSFAGEVMQPNQVEALEGVWEIPITVARSRIPEGYGGFKFADCTALCFSEIRAMLDACAAKGQKHFVMVFHSFSAVKSRDDTYTELRPNRIVIRRLDRTFRYLAENSGRFQVETMGRVATQLESLVAGNRGAAVIPDLNATISSVRKAVQLINGVYWI